MAENSNVAAHLRADGLSTRSRSRPRDLRNCGDAAQIGQWPGTRSWLRTCEQMVRPLAHARGHAIFGTAVDAPEFTRRVVDEEILDRFAGRFINRSVHASLAKRSVPLMISQSITAVCLFGSAGRLDWSNGWILIGLSSLTGVVATVVVWRDPELVAEPQKPR